MNTHGLIDSHNHLQDPKFDLTREDIIESMLKNGISHCVVNGTRPSDWSSLAQLSEKYPSFITPSFGFHPWFIDEINAFPNWENQLLQHITSRLTSPMPQSVGIGECGLDKSIQHPNLQRQSEVFLKHIQLANTYNLPLSIHCVRAWGFLIDLLTSTDLPKRGFLLHSYAGSKEIAHSLLDLGGYFSFSATLLHPNRHKLREVAKSIPPNRLLIETDAPNACPDSSLHPQWLSGKNSPINHPQNLSLIFKHLSSFLDTSQVNANSRLFFDLG